MSNPRAKRLKYEFERMLSIRKKEGLIDFSCADLSAREASAFLSARMSSDVVRDSFPGFLKPEEFIQQFPDRSPEKYLVMFRCIGLKKISSDKFDRTSEHLLEVVFGLDYPARPPRFVWITPIWHPNINPPYLCAEGRPFAIGTTLDQVCLMAGQMVQYRNYNLDDPLNKEAAAWAAENQDIFPVDTRGLTDGREHSRPAVQFAGNDQAEWTGKQSIPGSQLVELI